LFDQHPIHNLFLEYHGKEKGMEVVAITKEDLEEIDDDDELG